MIAKKTVTLQRELRKQKLCDKYIMKKILLYLIPCVLLIIVGCKPVNPPSYEETSAIIDLCYSSMGQSGVKLQQDLSNLGVTIPNIGFVDQYECFEIKNKSYHLSFSSINDTVVIVHYEIFFNGTFAEGVQNYIEVSNQLVDFGWNQWMGRSPENNYTGIENRPQFLNSTMEEVSVAKSSQLHFWERVESPMGDKYLHAEWFYWASDPLGMDIDTGEGLSDIKDSSIGIDITMDEWNFEELYN